MAIRYLLAVFCAVCFSIFFAPKSFGTTPLRFDEIQNLGKQNSPLIETAKRNYLHIQAEKREELRWQNPELGYERATAEDEAEQVIALGKEFEMPWVYGKRRSSWKHKLKAAEFGTEYQIQMILSHLKSGYVELQLKNRQLENMDVLVETLKTLFNSTQEQFETGTLSGIERQMIHFSLINLMGELNDLKKEYRILESSWLNDMGLNHIESPAFVTPFDYVAFDLMAPAEYSNRLRQTNPYRQMVAEVASSKEKLRMEKGSILPGFSVQAGIRNVDPDRNGYKVGFGIPLPILNRNTSRIQQQKLNVQDKEADLRYLEFELKAEIEQLVLSLQDQMRLFESNTSCYLSMNDYLDGVILAYKEGWMSLPEMLEGIELYVNGQTTLNNMVVKYYSDLFTLEAITGDTIVNLPGIKGEN